MANHRHRAFPALGPLALVLLLLAALFPALAAAAPPPGEGQLTITPPAIGFGPATVGTNSTEQQVEVRNESGVSIAISNVNLQGSEPSEFATGSNSCNTILATGQSCTVGVFFSPHSTGPKAAALRITSSDEAGEEDVALTGEGAAPQLSFEPGSYDFGLQPVDGEGDEERNFQLRNTGPAAIQIDNIGFEGPGTEAFNTGDSDCFGANLAPNQTCSLEIRFHPRDAIPYALNLRVSASGTNFTAALSGEGGDPNVSAIPGSLQFGEAALGSVGTTKTLTLTNSGNLAANFFLAFLTDGDVADFRLLSENCTEAPLKPGASCSAQVRFAPTSAGAKSSKLTFIEGGEGGPMQIDLGGTGLASGLALGPAGLSFGAQASGSSSPAQPATLTNTGSSPVEVDAASILGAGSDQFRLSDSCSGTVLAPGQSCQLAVRFAPDSEGPKSASLRVLAGGQKLTAALAGTAVSPTRVQLSLGSKPLRAKGATIAAGTFACQAEATCSVKARASISLRVRVGGRVRSRRLALPQVRLTLAPRASGALRFHLTTAQRAILANALGTSHIRVRYRWSSEREIGGGQARRPLR
jgi:hypothetical protein